MYLLLKQRCGKVQMQRFETMNCSAAYLICQRTIAWRDTVTKRKFFSSSSNLLPSRFLGCHAAPRPPKETAAHIRTTFL